MQEVKFVTASYEASSSLEIQGNRSKVEKYLDNGYYIRESRNGYWLLVKPAKVYVTLKKDNKNLKINIKYEICDYYGKSRISKKLYLKFLEDANKENIKFYLGGNQLIIE